MSRSYQLVLASTSSYRQKQLCQLTEDFLCIAPKVDETAKPGEYARQLSCRLALAKARAVATSCPQAALIIGADQTAALDEEILGKPLSEENAFQQLARCSGKTVSFYSGLCVLNNTSKEALCDSIVTEVRFRDLSEKEISAYLARENVLDCAGSFKCEGLGITLFEEIKSTDPSALIGLPLIQLNRFLLHFGLNVLQQEPNS